MKKSERDTSTEGLNRAFEVVRLGHENIESLLQSFVDGVEPENFGQPKASVFCSIFSNLVHLHNLNFMDSLFEASARYLVMFGVSF